MHEQPNDYTCGPAALANGLLAIGREISPELCATLCGTTEEGTNEHDIVRGARALGFACALVSDWYSLRGALLDGRPVLCAIAVQQPYDHWVVAIGVIGDRIIVVDSAQTDLVTTRTRADWTQVWQGPNGQYGLALDC